MYYVIAPFLIALPLLAGCASIEPVKFTDEHPASAAPTTPAQSQADSVLATAPFRSPAHPLHGEGRAPASIAAVHSPAATTDSTPAAVEYTCPMHPKVVEDHEGRCPICEMKLVPQKLGSEMAPGEAAP